MALVLSGERPAAAASSPSLLKRVQVWFAAAKARRAQHLALQSLIELEAWQLDDLGINRSDLFDAMLSQRATDLLNDRRMRRLRP